MNAIEIRNLSKSFRGLYAVDHLNMTVPVGAIYGFIGENGSGKSTTEKLICGLPFDTGTAGAGGIIMCMISKIFLAAVFVSIDNTPGFRDHECYHVPCRRDLVQSGDRPGEQCRTE